MCTKDKLQYGESSHESKFILDPKYMTPKDLRYYYRYCSMSRSPLQCKKLLLIVFCCCIFCYVCVDSNLKAKIVGLRSRSNPVSRLYSPGSNNSLEYFVNTPGCRMPRFKVINENILQFISPPENYECKKGITRTSDEGSELWLDISAEELLRTYNVSDLSRMQCYYEEFKRKGERLNEFGPKVKFKLEKDKPVKIPEGIEFLRVECLLDGGPQKAFYRDHHFFVVDKVVKSKKGSVTAFLNSFVAKASSLFKQVNFNEKVASITTTTPAPVSGEATHPDRVSVMMLGIDSLSHLNFLRQMLKTTAYIRKNLAHVEFWGYNKVEDNTFPNIAPVLSGLEWTELESSCVWWAPFNYFDRCPFIWDRYKEIGYRTLYAEDVSGWAVFNYNRGGFKEQPTDYYFKPLQLELEKFAYNARGYTLLCSGSRRRTEFIFELMRKLIPQLKKYDFFSFLWSVVATHDFLNMPALLDDDLHRALETFKAHGVLNKTVLFLISDHGIRFGSFRETYQGMMEERLPLFIAIYPPWFKQRYPLAIRNLKQNARRLTTPYDLHATLNDLIQLEGLRDSEIKRRTLELNKDENVLPRGISLFLPVPETRTCEEAGIAAHWCCCYERQDLPTNDGKVTKAARFIVEHINKRIKDYPQCRTLYLNSISSAQMATPHYEIVKQVNGDYSTEIMLKIQTKPGLAEYESTVRMSNSSINVTGTISRINLYRHQSHCINNTALKMFCYCYNQDRRDDREFVIKTGLVF